VKLATHRHMLPKSRMVELYLHSAICLHGIVVNSLSTGTTLLRNLRNSLSIYTYIHILSYLFNFIHSFFMPNSSRPSRFIVLTIRGEEYKLCNIPRFIHIAHIENRFDRLPAKFYRFTGFENLQQWPKVSSPTFRGIILPSYSE
jgi:hypothetical protein